MEHSGFCIAIGIGTKNSCGDWLEVFYPAPMFHPSANIVDTLKKLLHLQNGNVHMELDNKSCHALEDAFIDLDQPLSAKSMLKLEESNQARLITVLETDKKISSTPEAYLKLHLLSHRLTLPNTINLEGLFDHLPTVCWTSMGAIDPEELPKRQFEMRQQGKTLNVYSVDKFPKMMNYVIPSGIRIADSSRVRLGAYVGEGTTVMPEGSINFNAGTKSSCMVEGRISSGVVVGKGTDIGGGSSTMGTLSGGNDLRVSIGDNCLIGANSGVGIPLGNGCIVEAGLYVTASSKIIYFDGDKQKIAKAIDFSGISNLLFRRNSLTGAIECLETKKNISLNQKLHQLN